MARYDLLPRFPPGEYGQKHRPRSRPWVRTIGLILMAVGGIALSLVFLYFSASR